MELYNFKRVSGRLACAGQPGEGQLAAIAADDFKIVVNLGLSDAKYSLNDEAASVKALRIQYHHIPVLFEGPKAEELAEFLKIMESHEADKVLVHCAANYRASVFTGLYLFGSGALDKDAMHSFIEDIWQPDAVWEQFIEESVEMLKSN